MQLKLIRRNKTYVLMHKNIPVLAGDYDSEKGKFLKLNKIYDFSHVPFPARLNNKKVSLPKLNHWFRWRGIPNYRVSLDRLLSKLEVKEPEQLLSMYYALSVSDHYWIREEKDPVSYDKINFFRHRFDQDGFGRAMFSSGPGEVNPSALKTPNNTLCGFQKKAWFHREGGLYLLKGGTLPYQIEPVNEMLASEIGRRLKMDVVPYTTEVYENQIVSVCRNMIDLESELVPADDILNLKPAEKDKFQLFTYYEILQENGIADAAEKMDQMLILDYLMMNSDRHNQNFGILIDPDTMEWKKVAPIFDTGTGLACLKQDDEVLDWFKSYKYKLFNNADITEGVIAYVAKTLPQYDFSVLDDIHEYYAKALVEKRVFSSLSNERIRMQALLLKRRVNMIKKVQSKIGQIRV